MKDRLEGPHEWGYRDPIDAEVFIRDDTPFEAASTIRSLEARVAELEMALREIEKGAGPFSQDRLTHAINTIEAMKELAQAALRASEATAGREMGRE